MLDSPDEVKMLISQKVTLGNSSTLLNAMKALSVAHRERSILCFKKAIDDHGESINRD
jgi:hypothetical protein